MPVPTNQTDDKATKNTDLAAGSSSNQTDDQVTQDTDLAAVGSSKAKELEPQRAEEKRLLDEVVEASEKQDREAEQKLQESIGKEARLSQPHPKVASDVAEAGVSSPQREASKVVVNGPTVELPISEEEYVAGEKTKVSGKVSSDKGVFGVSSLAAFAMFIGRMIKIAHTHAKRIIFRKGTGDNAN